MMGKLLYEGYSSGKYDFAVREKFAQANIYAKNSQSILSKATGFINVYDFTLNPYRGCQYGCSYCYAAAFSPNSKMRDDWGKWVIVKANAAELLEKELVKWYQSNSRSPSIYMSSVTDPYQPIEAQEKLTRQLLEIMIIYKPKLVIQTRSPMITRDIDLLQRIKHLRINMSILTGSERVRKDFEPMSPSIKARLHAVKKIKQQIDPWKGYVPKISVTVTPLLPTFPEEQADFINSLAVADRVVIQEFHAQNQGRSLIASTRQEALTLTKKYAWWYDNEQQSYHQFKQQLHELLTGVEIKEGKEGFTYE
ncbi:SPL family radical SAM protein [Oscillatoria salina]|uniref:SPL family radical SAM protein n=1 Tax=Oscillatoria salina TaxID=331517 RepID=UPI001CCBC106|nr:radical SAM protein [Oscillatoria salina]